MEAASRKFGLLIARQRSGTGALGTTLDRQPGIRYLGEVFHPANVGQPLNYFTWLRDMAAEDPNAVLPDRGVEVLGRFLEKVVDPDAGLPILDVKYNSLHHIRSGFQAPNDVPKLIAICREAGTPIIHLRRRNQLEVFVSGLLADANKVWHARDVAQIKIESVRVATGPLLRFLASGVLQDQLMVRWLGARTRVLTVYYEEMFDPDGQVSQATATSLAGFLGLEPFTDRSVIFVKQNRRPLREAIENYDEVAEALSGSEFEWMLAER